MYNLPTGVDSIRVSVYNLPTGVDSIRVSVYNLPTGVDSIRVSVYNLPTGVVSIRVSVYNLPTGVDSIRVSVYNLQTGVDSIRVSVYNLPTGVDSILLPETTSINTTSAASPNTARTSVTATDSSLTVDVDNDLNIESVETEDADNGTPAPREQTSVHVDEIKPQETEPVKRETSKRTTIGFYTMKTQALRTPRVLIAFDDVSRYTEHRQAATQGVGATTQRSDVSMASTIAMRATKEPSRIQTYEPYTGNMVITPSIYVTPRGVIISPAARLTVRHTHTHGSHRPTSQSQCYND